MKVLIIAARGFEKGDDTGEYFSRAFKQEGCEVAMVSHRNVLRSNPFPHESFRKYFKRKADSFVLRGVRTSQPDVVVVIKGETLTPELLTEMRAVCKARFVNLFPDNPFNYAEVLATVPLYNLFCVKDTFVLEQLRLMGGENVRWLPQCADPDALGADYPISSAEQAQHECDVVLIGSIYRQRFEILKELDEFELHVWGSTVSDVSPNDPHVVRWHRGRPLVGLEKGAALRSARIALNTHHPLNDIHGVNMRTFEICGAGGFQLVDAKQDLKRCFEPGVEVATYSSRHELVEQVRHFLSRKEDRISIASRGLKRVRAGHTYRHRVKQLMEMCGFS